jgi:hypothetical protein
MKEVVKRGHPSNALLKEVGKGLYMLGILIATIPQVVLAFVPTPSVTNLLKKTKSKQLP